MYRHFGLIAILATSLGAAEARAATPLMTEAEMAGDEPIRLLLNVPAHRLYVYESGELTHTFRIAVGEVGHETPSGNYRVRDIIWNPWWHPPNSEWARGRQIESPGWNNPMGRVKMNFSNLLYIHGSPEVGLLGRAASKGCIRMSNEEVMELARIVHRYASPQPDDLLSRLAANETQTRTFQLRQGIPFRVIYQVAEVRDGNLIIYPDIYNKTRDFGAQVRAVLAAHGVESRQINREHLERLVEKGQSAIVSASLMDLRSVPVEEDADQETVAVN
jgi:murein L,D-transpeptidase YcbB/YkuD